MLKDISIALKDKQTVHYMRMKQTVKLHILQCRSILYIVISKIIISQLVLARNLGKC